MVAVMSTMQKDERPTVLTPELERPSERKHVLLTSWASVATALLLVVLIAGAFYVADLKNQDCTETKTPNTASEHNTKDYSRTYDYEGQQSREDFHVDEDEQTELIFKKSDDGNIELITAIDYRKKISATYVPAADQCLLLARTDMEWTDNGDDGAKNKTVEIPADTVQKNNYKVGGNLVTDLSILPDQMRVYCEGKPTYWVQPADDTELDALRTKRAVLHIIRVYYICRCCGCLHVDTYYILQM